MKANEIIVVDGGSVDGTVGKVRQFQRKYKNIKLLQEKCSRARGRNLGVEVAENKVIAMTDAGCIAEETWLEKLVAPFVHGDVDMVAGFYKMVGDTPLQKAMSVFLGVLPSDFGMKFLPSTRSVAFIKDLWEKVGGFPEELDDTAEDTIFNMKAIKVGAEIARVKTARVEWRMPETISEFSRKLSSYARGDAKSGILINPGKGISSHNIKVLLVFGRYVASFALLIYSLFHPTTIIFLVILAFAYIGWAYKKAGIWGIPLQFVADYSVMMGFVTGLVE